MTDIQIYTKTNCPYSSAAIELLDGLNVKYKNIILNDPKKREEAKAHFGHSTFPIIIINGKIIGGFDKLLKIQKSGELNKIINM